MKVKRGHSQRIQSENSEVLDAEEDDDTADNSEPTCFKFYHPTR